MSDLLSAWVLSSGREEGTPGSSLSSSLHQARLSYQAQEVANTGDL